ncbi:MULTISPECIES: GNAT family N-acetyltransferase [Streptomyces]|uniref:GNAT family N-acetyltransferase n=1 Tax=Streptomyces rhizosphaericus TaxID=114699 RepID=A0A6G4ARK2_9ACTN|nr:hypothetical protein [Streptomyces rhizosphaericus]NEW75299.1 hypothetical protein [Streptomyces rhizosphaericus]
MPASAAVIRDATHADLAAIAAIFGHYVTETVVTFEETPPTVEDWARRLAEGRAARRPAHPLCRGG